MDETQIIKSAMSLLGKRSARVNKRDYKAMSAKGVAVRQAKRQAKLNQSD